MKKPRAKETYRWHIRNAKRSTRALELKAQRLAAGKTRSEFDRERFAKART